MLVLVEAHEHCVPVWTTVLASSVPPRPGARVLMLSRCEENEWRDTKETLSAGCSVVVAGNFSANAERRARAVAGQVSAPLIALRPDEQDGSRDQLWRSVRSEAEVLSVLAGVVSVAATASRAIMPQMA